MSAAWYRVTAVSGALAVTLGALGAHMIIKKDESMRDIWKTASLYHMVHTCALGVVAASIQSGASKKKWAGYLFLGGIVFFCGPLYAIVVLNQKQPLNKIAPFGGMMFIFGWLALGFL